MVCFLLFLRHFLIALLISQCFTPSVIAFACSAWAIFFFDVFLHNCKYVLSVCFAAVIQSRYFFDIQVVYLLIELWIADLFVCLSATK